MKGAFGEFRFGDEDGITHNMSLGAWTIAVGTGGLDGTLVDLESTTFVGNTGDSTKIVYYSPTIAGFQLGLSYDPHTNSNGTNFASNDPAPPATQDLVDAGVTWVASFGAIDVKASVVGDVGRSTSSNTSGDTVGIQPGAVISFGGFSIAGAFGVDETAGAKHEFYNLGAATKLGPVALSVNWGEVLDTNNEYRQTEPNGLPIGSDQSNALILGAQIGLVPGVWLSGEASHFDLDTGRQRQRLPLYQPAAVHLLIPFRVRLFSEGAARWGGPFCFQGAGHGSVRAICGRLSHHRVRARLFPRV